MLLAITWPISFDRPEWLWLLLLIPAMAVVSQRALTGIEKYRRVTAIVLRCLVILFLTLALARIEYVKSNHNVAVMFVLDRSRSIPEEQRLAAQEYIRKVAQDAQKQGRTEDRVGVIGFDGQADLDLIPSRVGVKGFREFGFSMNVEPDRTNMASGMRLAMAAFPEGYAQRIVLLTDGNQNIGDVMEEVENAIGQNIAIDVVPLEYEHRDEILFDRIVVPSHASRDTKIPVRMVIRSRKPTKARITLEHNGRQMLPPNPEVELKGDMRPNVLNLPVELFSGGVHRFDARIQSLSPGNDSIIENNRATAFTFVEDQGRVLILTQDDSADEDVLFSALKREKVDVEMRTVSQLQLDLLKLQEYSVLLLSNMPADLFNEQQQKAMASYVKDFGGGLIMTGGKDAFGAGGWIGSPVEEVSPVSFDIKHKKIMPRGALAIIMHSCEIPRGNYWGEQVAVAAVKTISSRDYLGVICYNPMKGGPNWDVPLAPATNKTAITRTIQKMVIGDMPDFGSTMKIAVRDLIALKGVSQRHMIIISDGDPSPPSQATIQTMIDNQITCSTVGIGYGSHVMEKTLRDIARQTGGKFYPCKNPRQLPQIFVKEAKVVRRSLISEETFSPWISSYFAQTIVGLRQDDLPVLGGMVLTEPKADIMLPLVRKSKDGTADPVLAHWNYEMGKAAVFTSGWWKNWGAHWANWEAYGKFWAQLVRWTMRQAGSGDFDVITRLEGNQGKVLIEALNRDASYLNFLQINGLVTMPSMETQALQLTQTGPGKYEGTFNVNDDGNYLVNLRYTSPNKEQGLIRTGLSIPYSPEFRELSANIPLLDGILNRSSGKKLTMDPTIDDVFRREGLQPSVSRQPVWRWVVQWLLLPLFLLDVASRRLASTLAMSIYVELAVFAFLFGILYTSHASMIAYIGALVFAELVGWSVRRKTIVPTLEFFTASVTALARAGQRSSESLTQLKDVRDKVRGELDTSSKQLQQSRRQPLAKEGSPDPGARFDVGDEVAGKPAADLTQSLGGATVLDETEQQAQKPRKKADQEIGDTTSRLLRAKRRARDAMKDNKDEPKTGDS